MLPHDPLTIDPGPVALDIMRDPKRVIIKVLAEYM
jgi:hypothetical protein